MHLPAAGCGAAGAPARRDGAAVALKGRNADGSRRFNLGRACGEDGELLLCERIGTAALLLSRAAR